MEDRIKELSKSMTGDIYDIAKRIQTMLLYDTGNHVPLSFIIENIGG